VRVTLVFADRRSFNQRQAWFAWSRYVVVVAVVIVIAVTTNDDGVATAAAR
jgi:hypothetical protein